MTRIVNMYDNHLRVDQTWNKVRSNKRRKAIVDTDLESIIQRRIALLREFIVHSSD